MEPFTSHEPFADLGASLWLDSVRSNYDIDTLSFIELGMLCRGLREYVFRWCKVASVSPTDPIEKFDGGLRGDLHTDDENWYYILGLPLPPRLQELVDREKEPMTVSILRDMFQDKCRSKKKRAEFDQLLRSLTKELDT